MWTVEVSMRRSVVAVCEDEKGPLGVRECADALLIAGRQAVVPVRLCLVLSNDDAHAGR